MENKTLYNKRYIARFTIEAATPLKVGTGNKGLTTDEVVATDVNGLPYIPGTSLAGVLRSAFKKQNNDTETDRIFGKEYGSRLIISSAHLVGEHGTVIEGLSEDNLNTVFYNTLNTLAVRDHVKITHKVASDDDNHGKFETQVVFKGTRFVFEIEFIGNDNDCENWKQLFNTIQLPIFRIGGGTRKGFGEIRVINIEQKVFDLNTDDLDEYLNKGSSFNDRFGDTFDLVTLKDNQESIHYKLNLLPEDFFIFSAGHGSDDGYIKMLAKREKIILWKHDCKPATPYFSNEQILIPATSIKGAISHRTAYHYNKLTGKYADEVEEIEKYIEEENEAVKALFGFKVDDKTKSKGHRGSVIISDLYKKESDISRKLLNHVAIDRFTGGAIDGKLFNEEVIKTKEEFELNIYINDIIENENIIKAFELALKDIATGMLPLGGSVMRGHGCFQLTEQGIFKNSETLNLEEL